MTRNATQDEPVERILNDQRSERRQKEKIEAEKCHRGQRQTQGTTAARTPALNDEQIGKRDVRLVET